MITEILSKETLREIYKIEKELHMKEKRDRKYDYTGNKANEFRGYTN